MSLKLGGQANFQLLDQEKINQERNSSANANTILHPDVDSLQLKTLQPPPIEFLAKDDEQEIDQKSQESENIAIDPQNQSPCLDASLQFQIGNKEIGSENEEEEGSLVNFEGSSFVIPPSLPEPSMQFKASAEQLTGNTKAGSNSKSLDGATLQKMNGAFATDFSDVAVHADSSNATAMGALAYAKGNDIHFAPGQYNPNSSAGQELIGHELTHVQQQREGKVKPTKQAKGLAINDEKGLEEEADRMGRKAARFKTNGNTSSIKPIVNHIDAPVAPQLKANIIGKSEISETFQLKEESVSKNVLSAMLEPILLSGQSSANKFYGVKSGSQFIIKSLLKSAKWGDISSARTYLESKSQKKLEELLIDKMKIGDTITPELISSIYYVRNPFKAGLHLDLGLCLLTPKTEADIIIRVLERAKITTKERKSIRSDYDRTFMLQSWGGSNLSRTGFTQDIMKRFSKDNEKKILALLDHELTSADHLVHHITGKVDPKAALNVFTSTLEISGFAGIKQLEADWNKYITKNLEGVHYPFHKKPLFKAVKSTFGEDSQVWQTISPIEKNYRSWAFSEGMDKLTSAIGLHDSENKKIKLNTEKAKNELMLETALKVIEQATISVDKGDGDLLSNIKYEVGSRFTKGTAFETKNYEEQVFWAIRTVKKVMPQLIKESTNKFEKGILLARWLKIKIQIDTIIDRSFKGDKKKKANLELSRSSKTSSPWVDDFYIAVQSGDKEKTVSLAHKIWAGNKIDKLHQVLSESDRIYSGFEISGNARIRSAILVSNSALARGGGELIDRGYRRLKYEILEKKPDLNYIKAFIVDTKAINSDLLDKSIAKFLQKESLSQIHALFHKGKSDPDKRQLLDIIKYRKYTKEVDEWNLNTGKVETKTKTKKPPAEFLKFSAVLVPLRTNEEKIKHAEEYAKLQGGNGNVKEALGEVEMDRMHAINQQAEGLESYKSQAGTSNEAELMDISVEELQKRYDEARKELEAEAAFFSFVVEMITYGAIAVLSGGSTIGLLAAAVASKAAGMGANELVLQEKYELFSESNLKTLTVTSLTEIASLGVGSKFSALKKTEAFVKLSKTKKVAFAIAEQATTQVIGTGIESVVMGKLPEWDKEVLDLIVESLAAGVKVNIGGIENEKSFIRNAVVELIMEETPKEIGKALLLSSVRGVEFDANSFTKQMISSVTKKLSKAVGERFKINKAMKKDETEETDVNDSENRKKINEENSSSVGKPKEDRGQEGSKSEQKEGKSKLLDEVTDPNLSQKEGKDLGQEEISSPHFPNTFLSIDLLHVLRRKESPRTKAEAYIENVRNWDLLLSSVDRDDPIFLEARKIRSELKDLALSNKGYLRGDANTRDDSDMDFQYQSGQDLLQTDYKLRSIYGADYKEKYKVDLFINADRIKNSDQISDSRLRASAEVEMAHLSRMFDLLRLKKITPESDPKYARLLESIERLPPELKTEFDHLSNLKAGEREQKWRELLIYSDQLNKELNTLQDQEQKDQNKIDAKRREVDLVQIMINGLSDDAYTAKSIFGGNNEDSRLNAFTELSNHYTFVQKMIQKYGGLGRAGKNYEIYKYLNRALNTLKKNGQELSSRQEDLLRHSDLLYGEGEDAIRDFYTEYFRGKNESEIAKRLGEEVEGIAKIIDNMEAEIMDSNNQSSASINSKGKGHRSIASLSQGGVDSSSPMTRGFKNENGETSISNSRKSMDIEEAKRLLALDSNIEIPERWKKPQVSKGDSVIVYRGFSRRAQQKMESGVLRVNDDRGGGTMSRDIDAANDAVHNKVDKPFVSNGPNKGGVVKVIIPSEIWNLLVESKSISEDNYPGFRGDLSSTEIRVNSNAAIRIINSLPQQIVESNAKTVKKRNNRPTAKIKAVREDEDEARKERSNRPTAKMKAVSSGEESAKEERSKRPTAKLKAVGEKDDSTKEERANRATAKMKAVNDPMEDDDVGQKKESQSLIKKPFEQESQINTRVKIPSDVRITKNSEKASNLNAQAFTQGKDVHFAPGHYKPNTKAGKALIGHELEHVKQQNEGRVEANKTEKGFKINDDPILEKEADQAGEKFAQENSRSPFQLKSRNKVQQNKNQEIVKTSFSLETRKVETGAEDEDLKPFHA